MQDEATQGTCSGIPWHFAFCGGRPSDDDVFILELPINSYHYCRLPTITDDTITSFLLDLVLIPDRSSDSGGGGVTLAGECE